MRPALRGVAELVHQALLDAGLLILILEGQLRVLDLRLQPRVACQADDAVHARALAIVDDALAAKARVAAEDDSNAVLDEQRAAWVGDATRNRSAKGGVLRRR